MKKIAILGASYLQLPLVEKSKENNLEVHCFAWDDGRAICKSYVDFFYDISVTEKELILAKCQEIGIDGILTIATDICIPTISYVASRMGLISNSEKCAEITTNKAAMRACFEENNIKSPKYRVLKTLDDANLEELKFPLILKPTDRSGSLGVKKINNKQEFIKEFESSLSVSISKECIIEEYIEGREVSVETISWKGEHHIITITDKVVTEAPYFVELAHHQPSSLPVEIQDNINLIAQDILKVTGVEYGASHIELKITDNREVFVIEIGSRMGGDFIGSDLVKLSTGYDYLQAVLDIATNKFSTFSKSNHNKFSGVYFLSKNTEKILNYFISEDCCDFKIIKKELLNQELKFVESSNDRSGFLIYQSDKKVDLL